MDRTMCELIDESIELQNELRTLTPMLLFLNPFLYYKKTSTEKISPRTWDKFRKRMKESDGLEGMKIEYILFEGKLRHKLSVLAELLEEEGFEIERFIPRLTEGQLSWLLSHKGIIKRHLKGIEIGTMERRYPTTEQEVPLMRT
jgi:hypothetical protein